MNYHYSTTTTHYAPLKRRKRMTAADWWALDRDAEVREKTKAMLKATPKYTREEYDKMVAENGPPLYQFRKELPTMTHRKGEYGEDVYECEGIKMGHHPYATFDYGGPFGRLNLGPVCHVFDHNCPIIVDAATFQQAKVWLSEKARTSNRGMDTPKSLWDRILNTVLP